MSHDQHRGVPVLRAVCARVPLCVAETGGTPRACMMVAAPVWDTVGAQSASFNSALIARAGNRRMSCRSPSNGPGLPQPNIVVPDLEALGCGLPGSENMS